MERTVDESPGRSIDASDPGARAGAPVKRFYLESYGCQMNVYDTQGLSRMLEDHGFTRVDQPESADVVPSPSA